jgi:endonuclease/exonuclease/phosphatase family metal-dependent hydrolase
MNKNALSRFSMCFGTLLVLLQAIGAISAQESGVRKSLRILSYNIHHGEGVDGRVDLLRQAEVIKACSPDLVALQEVDDRTERTDHVDQTARLAEFTGLHGRFVHQLDFEGGRYGQAILSKHPVSDVTVHWLPGSPDRERRVAGSVVVQLDDQEIIFVTTHLHHNNEAFRRQQASQLNQIFASSLNSAKILAVVAGDLNATPKSVPLGLLTEKWQSVTEGSMDMPTFPAETPERQLDYILLHPAGRAKVNSVKVIDAPVASDHRPLLAEIQFSQP